jgi:Na+-transporting methylmalonyl-CoA/oxaloacetate decarboxylase gamma subunit
MAYQQEQVRLCGCLGMAIVFPVFLICIGLLTMYGIAIVVFRFAFQKTRREHIRRTLPQPKVHRPA